MILTTEIINDIEAVRQLLQAATSSQRDASDNHDNEPARNGMQVHYEYCHYGDGEKRSPQNTDYDYRRQVHQGSPSANDKTQTPRIILRRPTPTTVLPPFS